MEKRKNPRVQSDGYRVDVSDGRRFFSGSLNNFSRHGLCLEDIPRKIDHSAKRLSVVLSGRGKNFKFMTRICWAEEQSFGKMLGLEILTSPWGWAEFVMAQEPAADTSWAEVEA